MKHHVEIIIRYIIISQLFVREIYEQKIAQVDYLGNKEFIEVHRMTNVLIYLIARCIECYNKRRTI